MDVKIVTLPTEKITDWDTFHTVCKDVFGFPDFYGRNMDAWIDCMYSINSPEHGMTKVHVDVGGILVIKVDHAEDFKERCPEQHDALVECTAFVNYGRARGHESNPHIKKEEPILALMLIGNYPNP